MSSPSRDGFRLRPFVTGLAAAAFLALFASGAILFIAPSGRVARDTGWTLAGLSREGWEEIHVAFTVLFVMAVAVHLAINRLGFRTDLLGRSKRRPALRPEFVAALGLALLLAAAAAFDWPPAREMMALHDHLRETLWQDRTAGGQGTGATARGQGAGQGQGQGGGAGLGRTQAPDRDAAVPAPAAPAVTPAPAPVVPAEPEPAAADGAAAFRTYCARCHTVAEVRAPPEQAAWLARFLTGHGKARGDEAAAIVDMLTGAGDAP